ncbi:MAG: hypothetical protein RLZ35_573 [Pseudomonadota bacterium]
MKYHARTTTTGLFQQQQATAWWVSVLFGIALWFVLGFANSANALSYYVWTPNTGAQTQIDNGHTSEWWITANGSFDFQGGHLSMKKGSSATNTVTLSLYRGTSSAGTLLGTVTLPASSFSGSYTDEFFNYSSPVTFSPGTYYVSLTSTAPPQQAKAFFIKGNRGAIISIDGVTPISSSLATISTTLPVGLTDFLISTASNGINCTGQNVTVTARSNGSTLTTYNKQITLDTQSGSGNWSLVTGAGTFNQATANSGIANYTYSTSDNGVAVFSLSYPSGTSTITLKAYETATPTLLGTFGPVNFYPSAFVITASPVPNPPTGTVASFGSTLTAGTAANMYITAYGTTAFDATCGVIETYTGSKTINMWSSYVNPTSGTIAGTIGGTAIGTSSAAPTTQTVNFLNGQATVLFNYQDAGSLIVSFKDASVPLPVGGIVGSTGTFVVKPAQFVVSITSPTNPAAASATDPVFVKAGAPFSATVQAKSSTGANTPNYGNETTPASVTLASSTVVLPVGGRNGSTNAGVIANGSNFTKTGPGLFSSSALSFDEVGIFKFTASVKGGSYLGAGNVSGPETGNIGRFYPNNFAVTGNSPAFNAGCVTCGFTYMDQPFSFATNPVVTVTAQSLGGTTTQNYTGSFWRLLLSSLNTTYTSSSSLTLNSSSPASSVTFVDNGNGTGTYTFGSGTGFKLQRVSALSLSPPESLEVRLASTYTDQDGVTYASNPYVFGGTATGTGISFNGGKTFYFGRMTLANTSGSELSPLSVAFQTEYYNGTDFQVNTADNGTSFSNPAWVSITPTPNTLSTTVSITPISNGIGAFTLSAPSPSGTLGSVVVQPDLSSAGANLPWLQFAWPSNTTNTTGQLTDNPSAVATFGVSEGSKQIIYQNEVVR